MLVRCQKDDCLSVYQGSPCWPRVSDFRRPNRVLRGSAIRLDAGAHTRGFYDFTYGNLVITEKNTCLLDRCSEKWWRRRILTSPAQEPRRWRGWPPTHTPVGGCLVLRKRSVISRPPTPQKKPTPSGGLRKWWRLHFSYPYPACYRDSIADRGLLRKAVGQS